MNHKPCANCAKNRKTVNRIKIKLNEATNRYERQATFNSELGKRYRKLCLTSLILSVSTVVGWGALGLTLLFSTGYNPF